MRVYALYQRNRYLLTFMVMFFLSLVVVSSLEIIDSMILKKRAYAFSLDLTEDNNNLSLTVGPLPGIHYCINVTTRDSAWWYWTQLFAFETFLFILVLIKAVRSLHGEQQSLWIRLRRSSLFDVLVCDSVIYYFA